MHKVKLRLQFMGNALIETTHKEFHKMLWSGVIHEMKADTPNGLLTIISFIEDYEGKLLANLRFNDDYDDFEYTVDISKIDQIYISLK